MRAVAAEFETTRGSERGVCWRQFVRAAIARQRPAGDGLECTGQECPAALKRRQSSVCLLQDSIGADGQPWLSCRLELQKRNCGH